MAGIAVASVYGRIDGMGYAGRLEINMALKRFWRQGIRLPA